MDKQKIVDKRIEDKVENFVIMNVNGSRFQVAEEIFQKMIKSAQLDITTFSSTDIEYFFNRNLRSFLMILDYFQHGELHLPQDLCPNIFKRELKYWGLSDTRMEDCCHRKMISHEEDDEMLKSFHRNVSEPTEGNSEDKTCFLWRMKWKLWCILDKPGSSRMAKVYLVISVIFVIISIFVMAAGTHSTFLRELDTEEFEELYNHKFGKPPPAGMKPPSRRVRRHTPGCVCLQDSCDKRGFGPPSPSIESTDEIEPGLNNKTIIAHSRLRRNASPSPTQNTQTPDNKTQSPLKDPPFLPPREGADDDDEDETITEAHARIVHLDYLEYAAMTFFTIELIVRFLVCPSKCGYLKDAINICDMISLAAMYIKLLVDIALPTERYGHSLTDFIECLQTFRVFRFFRIVKDVIGLRVLIYTIKMSTKELCLLILYLLLCIVMFSGIVYYCERSNMESIPDAMWWVVVTMTTVGYGDMYPTSYPGKLVGCLAAICGVLLIAVTIPVFVNNFILFYNFSKTLEVDKATAKKKGIKKVKVEPSNF